METSRQPEQYNLYNGLRAMSAVLVSLAQVVDNVERQCNSITQQLHQIGGGLTTNPDHDDR